MAKKLKFRYQKHSAEIIRPVIPVEVFYNGRKVLYEVLIDSGADKCIFDAQVGELLGIDFKKGTKEKVSGITGARSLIMFIP